MVMILGFLSSAVLMKKENNWISKNIHDIVRWISCIGTGAMIIITTTFKAHVYIYIQDYFLIPLIENYFRDTKVIFLVDKWSCLRANEIKAFVLRKTYGINDIAICQNDQIWLFTQSKSKLKWKLKQIKMWRIFINNKSKKLEQHWLL